MPDRPTPLGAIGRGLVAGAAGTAVMTGYQELAARVRGGSNGDGGGDSEPSWDEAPAPAKVARRVVEGVFRRDVSAKRIPLLTHAVHWAYGTSWGAVYGIVEGSLRSRRPALGGLALGAGVWAASYLQLVPMGIYKRPWEYPATELGWDVSYHLVYGAGVAAGYEAAQRL